MRELQKAIERTNRECNNKGPLITEWFLLFASEMHRRGMEIHMISKLMGHANIATTQRYIYTADDHLHAEYNKYSA